MLTVKCNIMSTERGCTCNANTRWINIHLSSMLQEIHSCSDAVIKWKWIRKLWCQSITSQHTGKMSCITIHITSNDISTLWRTEVCNISTNNSAKRFWHRKAPEGRAGSRARVCIYRIILQATMLSANTNKKGNRRYQSRHQMCSSVVPQWIICQWPLSMKTWRHPEYGCIEQGEVYYLLYSRTADVVTSVSRNCTCLHHHIAGCCWSSSP